MALDWQQFCEQEVKRLQLEFFDYESNQSLNSFIKNLWISY